MNHEEAERLIVAQFEGAGLSVAEQRELRAYLRESERGRALYDRHAALEQALEHRSVPRAQLERMRALGAPPPAGQDMGEAGHGPPAARGAGEPTESGPRGHAVRRVVAATAALAAAAAAVVALWPRGQTGVELAARGGDDEPHASVRAFVTDGGSVAPLGDELRSGAGLLFAYSNTRESPYRYLVVYGQDVMGKVHWYYPAYEDVKDDPRSVPIETGVADRELPDAAYADHPPGRLDVCAWFTEQPLRVRRVDALLESGRGAPDEGIVRCQRTHVRRPR